MHRAIAPLDPYISSPASFPNTHACLFSIRASSHGPQSANNPPSSLRPSFDSVRCRGARPSAASPVATPAPAPTLPLPLPRPGETDAGRLRGVGGNGEVTADTGDGSKLGEGEGVGAGLGEKDGERERERTKRKRVGEPAAPVSAAPQGATEKDEKGCLVSVERRVS